MQPRRRHRRDCSQAYRSAGVNRVSIGVQSMVPSVLASLGRWHVPDNVVHAVEAVRASGMPTWNLDLIYGGAGETLADWEHTVRAAVSLEPPHISAYALTVEAGTPLAAQPERHPDDDDLADKYELADDLFAAAGLVELRGEQLVVARPRVAAQPAVLAAGRLLRLRVGGALAPSTVGAGGTCAHPSATSPRCRPVESTEAVGRDARRGDSPRSRACSWRCACARACRSTRSTSTGSTIWSQTDGVRVTLTRRGRLLANEVSLRLR